MERNSSTSLKGLGIVMNGNSQNEKINVNNVNSNSGSKNVNNLSNISNKEELFEAIAYLKAKVTR